MNDTREKNGKKGKKKEVVAPVALTEIGRKNVIEYLEEQSIEGVFMASRYTYWCSRSEIWRFEDCKSRRVTTQSGGVQKVGTTDGKVGMEGLGAGRGIERTSTVIKRRKIDVPEPLYEGKITGVHLISKSEVKIACILSVEEAEKEHEVDDDKDVETEGSEDEDYDASLSRRDEELITVV